MVDLSNCRLYGILDLGYVARDSVQSMASQLVEGGIDILQLRAKSFEVEVIKQIAIEVLHIAKDGGVPFIINDYPDIAADVGADGVHVGQDDTAVTDARAIVGSQAIVGKSTHSVDQAVATNADQVDYIGFGPLYATPTKPEYPPIGAADIATVYQQVKVPVFCIGGIKRHNLPDIVAQGAQRAVIVSGLLQTDDVAGYIAHCKALLT